jgi:serine/threonine protein kinase
VQVLDGGSQPDGSLYIVHELLEGVSMSDAVARNTLTASAVIQLGVELLQALAAAHTKGIIHRDIKPDNVFIAQDGSGGVSIKLLDFGIASLRDTSDGGKLTRPGSVLGTAQYMSPEQAMAAPVDERSDLWSVGALLYHALCGQLPYPGDTFSAVICALASKQRVPLAVHRPDLPTALVEVVERALRKPSVERFASAVEMGAALAAVSFDGAERAASSKPSHGPAPQAAPTRMGDAPLPRHAATRRSQPGVSAATASSHASAESQHSSTPAFVKFSLSAGTMLLCTLAWIVLHDRGADARAAVGQLAAADVPQTSPSTLPSPSAPLFAQEGADQTQPAAKRGLPLSALAPVLSSRQAQLERCLQESAVSQLLAGAERVTAYRLDVSLTVAASGQVQSVELSGAAPAELVSCLRAELLAATFPGASESTAFRYPLVLTPTVLGQ